MIWSLVRWAGLAVLGLAASATGQVVQTEPVAANPGRPTITNPATITPVGYLQFEQGYLGSLNSPNTDTQYGVNQTVKLAVHPRLMLEVQSQPFAVSTVDGVGTTRDAGDLLAGGQFILWNPPDTSDDAVTKDIHRHAYVRSALPTIAFAYLNVLRSGSAPDIDLGSQDRTAVFLFSGHAPGIDVHYDINLVAGQQSEDDPTGVGTATRHVRRAQYGQTFSVDRPFPHLTPNLQFSAEIYHFTQPLVHSTSNGTAVPRANLVGALLAFGYQFGQDLVLDCGFEHGLPSTSTQWQSFAGFTYLLPHRLWKK